MEEQDFDIPEEEKEVEETKVFTNEALHNEIVVKDITLHSNELSMEELFQMLTKILQLKETQLYLNIPILKPLEQKPAPKYC